MRKKKLDNMEKLQFVKYIKTFFVFTINWKRKF